MLSGVGNRCMIWLASSVSALHDFLLGRPKMCQRRHV